VCYSGFDVGDCEGGGCKDARVDFVKVEVGVRKITAANFGGRLGPYQIRLTEALAMT
jgi:hypothetical protein